MNTDTEAWGSSADAAGGGHVNSLSLDSASNSGWQAWARNRAPNKRNLSLAPQHLSTRRCARPGAKRELDRASRGLAQRVQPARTAALSDDVCFEIPDCLKNHQYVCLPFVVYCT